MKKFSSHWIDTFRFQYPNLTDVYTVFDRRSNSRASNIGARIDYIFSPTSFWTPSSNNTSSSTDMEPLSKPTIAHSPLISFNDISSFSSPSTAAVINTPPAYSDHVAIIAVFDDSTNPSSSIVQEVPLLSSRKLPTFRSKKESLMIMFSSKSKPKDTDKPAASVAEATSTEPDVIISGNPPSENITGKKRSFQQRSSVFG